MTVRKIEIKKNDENRAILSGTVVSPVELKQTRIGIPVVDIMLSVKGLDADEDLIPCRMKGAESVFLSRECREGDYISISGSVKSYKRRDKYGNEYNNIYILISDYCVAERKPKPKITDLVNDDL